MTARIGSLCSGAGGLDLAVEAVFGAETVWHCEIDDAASKVLAHRSPGVPNHRDLIATDWTAVEPIDIFCAGWPCQPFSLAGKRKGADDDRAIWPHIAGAVRVLRPRIVVLENVTAVLAVEFGRVADSLAALGYDLRWTSLRASDVGAPHRRERLFVVASDTQGERRTGRDESQPHMVGDGSQSAHVRSLGAAPESVELLPTPCAQQSGNTPENHLAKKPGRKVVTDLAILVENGLLESGGELLPTPRATDPKGNRNPPGRVRDGRLRTTGDDALPDAITALLPTPRSSDTNGAGQHGDGGMDLRTTVSLLATPSTADGGGGHLNRSGDRKDELLLPGQAREMATAWGKYESAIRRWEQVTRPAPAPTEPNTKGNPRLSAAFSEWLMGWPAGWVTEVPGISRNDQLRIVGNGVVPQQAIAALRWLLNVSEVAA